MSSSVAHVYSAAPKLSWSDFLRVLKVFMLGSNQERESDIQNAFDILDQGRKGVFGRTISLSDGLISPDELRAFLSILTDEVNSDGAIDTLIQVGSLSVLVPC